MANPEPGDALAAPGPAAGSAQGCSQTTWPHWAGRISAGQRDLVRTSLSPVSQGEEISVSRVFDAPRDLVYRAFVDPDQFCQWFGPADFSVPYETVQSDARTGGFQRFVLVNDADPSHRTPVDVALNEVVEDELLVAHADIGAIAGAGSTARTRVRLEFLDQSSGRTRLELRQDPSRDEICGDPEAAWESSFTRLDSLLRRSL